MFQSIVAISKYSSQEKYLGLPSSMAKSRYQSFSDLYGKVWERVNIWENSYLSQGGKEVLLKVVIQAIPTYPLSVFQLPRKICKVIEATMTIFWWGHKTNDWRIHWQKSI